MCELHLRIDAVYVFLYTQSMYTKPHRSY